MKKSKRYQINKTDIKKILTGAGVAGAGAALTYLVEVLPNIELGDYSPLVVALFSVLANAVRKWLAGK